MADFYDSTQSGLAMDDAIAKRPQVLNSAPTTSTEGVVGGFAVYGKKVYTCTAVNGSTYTWELIEGVQPVIPTIPTALADLTDDATHRVVTDTEKSTWNAKQSALNFESTPSSNNPVITKSEMGTSIQSYTSGTGTSVSGTITVGQALMYNPDTARTSVTVTLGVVKGTGYTSEWHLGFKAGASCAVTITPPSGYTIKWKDGIPTWADGKWYEIDFIRCGSYIFAIASETDMS